MGASLLGIGASGLAAAQAGLATTGHNISNVNTPGFSRQEVLQSNRLPLFTGSGFMGQGVDVTAVRRVYSDFLTARATMSQADSSALTARNDQLAQLDGILGDSTSGLQPALEDFYAGLNALAATPNDPTARQTALSGARSLVGRFQQLDSEVAQLRQTTNQRIASDVSELNAAATQIAKLNQRIADVSSGADATQQPNDLLDQRDQLVRDLNTLVGATAVAQQDGTYNIFLTNGQALVVGAQAMSVSTVPDLANPQDVQLAVATGGTLLRLSSKDFSGGEVGGLLAFRDNDLTGAQNELGRLAAALGTSFNAQHHLGQDLTGALGGDFFTVPSPQVEPNLRNQGTGVVTASIQNMSAVTGSDYVVTYDGTGYTIQQMPNGTAQALPPGGLDGLTFTTSGTPQAGDSFLVSPTRYAAGTMTLAISDITRIAAAAPVRTAVASTNTGTGTISVVAVSLKNPTTPLAGTVKLTYAAATNTLTFSPPVGAPVTYSAGAPITFGGISFAIDGTPADGDTFSVSPNAGGVGDNRNAQLLAATAQAKVLDGGTMTITAASSRLVGSVGSAAHEAQVESDAQAHLLAQAKAAEAAVSGVNLDEEAANLQRYQLAYQAAGKVMAIASSLFDVVLEIAKA